MKYIKPAITLVLLIGSYFIHAQNPFVPKYDAVKRSERCYTVTWPQNNQFGAVWWREKVDFSRDTLFNFVIYMGDKDGNGSDGMAFIMHQDPRDTITDPSQQLIIGGAGTWDLAAATGDDGGGLGFAMHQSRVGPNTIPGPHGPGDDPENHKIQQSVAIEFDTWNNNDVPDGNSGTDANGVNHATSPYFGWDHTAVIYNGDLYGGQQVITDANGNSGRILPLKPSYAFGTENNPDGSPFNNIEDDQAYLYQIRWKVNTNGTQDLQLWAQVYNGTTNTDELKLIMSHSDDMINSIFGGSTLMRIGFTGSTGGANNEQTICLLGENQKPFAQDDYANISLNETSIINIESNDNDPDGDQLHVPVIITMPKNGQTVIFDSLDINFLRYTPNTNYVGKDTISYVTCDVNSTKPYAKCDTADVFILVQDQIKDIVEKPNYNKSYFNVEIMGEDTVCANSQSSYEMNINTNGNKYFSREENINTPGGNGWYALGTGYHFSDVKNIFTYDLWVKPTQAITMKSESSVCPGGVSVPLAFTSQNWALVPLGLGGGDLDVGLTIGTNGVMIGEHAGNILVSRLSYTTTINDWIHVAIVYDTDNIYLYLDGALVKSKAIHCPSNPKCVTPGLTGYYYSNDFRGSIDEFRLWDKALTGEEVSSLMGKKLVNEVPNLRYYASFDNEQFIKALGDLEADSMDVREVTPELHIKASTWDLDPYMGENTLALFPFTIESLDYLWSTNGTDKSISFSPKDGNNEITAQAYNEYLTISDTINIVGKDCETVANDTRYLRFRSYYSEDNSQVNVYEIQTYLDGVNVALNKATSANSHEGGAIQNEANAVDGDGNSRWSSDRNDPGPDASNPHYITIDLLQNYNLDSIILDIQGFDSWDQTFDLSISSDSVNWKIIGNGVNTTGIFTYLTNSGNSSELEFKMNEENVTSNQQIIYPITVKDFQNILTAQYTISWDPAVVEYQGIQDFALRDLGENAFHLFEPGKLTFSWNPSDLQAESVDDDTQIFNIIFTTTGTAGQETLVSFTDVPTSREISGADGNILDANYVNGKITIIDEVILGGYIKTQKGEALVGIEVELNGALALSTLTDQYGWFSFSVLPDKEYHIAPSFDTEADDGVTTLDIVIMHWHILGKKYMMSNHDLIACDVNQSKSLTTLDLAETRAVILHNKEKFRDRNAVEFVNHEYTGSPDIFEYKNSLDIKPAQSLLDLNFTAVKIGDGGRSWKAKKNSNGREFQLEELEIILEKGQVANDRVIVDLRGEKFNEVVGLQFTLEWNPSVYGFKGLSEDLISFNSNLKSIDEGILTVTWNSDQIDGITIDEKSVLSNLEFEVLDEDRDPNLNITSGITPAYAYNSDLESLNIKSSFHEKLMLSELTVYPNPASESIQFSLGNQSPAEFSILSTTGKIVSAGKLNGHNNIDVSSLRSGIYFLQVADYNNQKINKRFIKQ